MTVNYEARLACPACGETIAEYDLLRTSLDALVTATLRHYRRRHPVRCHWWELKRAYRRAREAVS